MFSNDFAGCATDFTINVGDISYTNQFILELYESILGTKVTYSGNDLQNDLHANIKQNCKFLVANTIVRDVYYLSAVNMLSALDSSFNFKFENKSYNFHIFNFYGSVDNFTMESTNDLPYGNATVTYSADVTVTPKGAEPMLEYIQFSVYNL
jgi:hypothetical protein